MKERMASGFLLVTFGSVKVASQAGHGSNRLACVFAAFAIAWIWPPAPARAKSKWRLISLLSNVVSVIDTRTKTHSPGSTEGAEWITFISGGYDSHFGHLTVGPIASLQYTYVSIDGFSENGSLRP